MRLIHAVHWPAIAKFIRGDLEFRLSGIGNNSLEVIIPWIRINEGALPTKFIDYGLIKCTPKASHSHLFRLSCDIISLRSLLTHLPCTCLLVNSHRPLQRTLSNMDKA